MRNIADKVDGVDSLSGDEYTSHKDEPLNVITASGQTPSGSDAYQTAKAISLAATNGDYFTDTGGSSSTNYIHLLPRTGNVTQPQYEVGTRVRFIPSATNTSTTVYIKLGSFLARYVSHGVETNPSTYPTSCPVGFIKSSRAYTATYMLHPNGVNYYWALDVIENEDIADGAIEARNMGANSVTLSAMAPLSVDNDNLVADINLNKIIDSALTMENATYRVYLDKILLKYGKVTEPNTEILKGGIRYSGTGSPGNLSPTLRVASYNIQSQMAAASLADAETRTASTHAHRIGQQYIFASNFDTGIPIGSSVYGATMSYTELSTGRRILGVPVIITADNGSSNIEIIAISTQHVKDAGVDYTVDTSAAVLLNISVVAS